MTTVSAYLYVAMPAVAFVGMIFWLALVFYAAERPGHRPSRSGTAVARPEQTEDRERERVSVGA